MHPGCHLNFSKKTEIVSVSDCIVFMFVPVYVHGNYVDFHMYLFMYITFMT